ncbi:MAG: DNA methyltransferase [Pirellulales bacterium]
MKQASFFREESAVAARQAKTDPLFLARTVKDAAESKLLPEDDIALAHQILVKWADLEKSGQLATKTENELQGDLLEDVFGKALGYRRIVDSPEGWEQAQHPKNLQGPEPDGILGHFKPGQPIVPDVVIELKGPLVHLDRDRSRGRTAVDQCWDYMVNMPPECQWGIVSNMVSFRLYERNSTKRAYEHFELQWLRDRATFRKFYAVFHRKALIEKTTVYKHVPEMLKATADVQREVGENLYKLYADNRLLLIEHLHQKLGHDLDTAIEMVQRLLDRVIFIAFCEDRKLLPEKTITEAAKISGFYRVTNPKWQSFKTLFQLIDVGAEAQNIPKYNGGLFAKHPVDNLELPDNWTDFFQTISGFSFADEVNLDVLGHLFERSITELERLKSTGILADAEKAERYAQMPQSVKRKQLGIYYTPPELTSLIVKYTVEELIDQRFAKLAVELGTSDADARKGLAPDTQEFWRGCLDILRNLKIIDPACGSGAFLFQAYNALESRYLEVIGQLERLNADDAEELGDQIPHYILQDNLYGVDLSPEAVEITQLALWIRSATRGQTLATLSRNIVHGNSLVHDPEVESGFVWRERFPEVFERNTPSLSSPAPSPSRGGLGRGEKRVPATITPPLTPPRSGEGDQKEDNLGGFDCVIGNPPWERIKLQEREFFSFPAPEIATATNAAKRRQMVAKLESDDPQLYGRYQAALRGADALLTYCRKSDEYPLTGKGDINLYAVFAELASQLVAPHGRVGMLTPSGIASDMTTKDFFASIAENDRLIRLYDFENKKNFFPDVHASFKFCILNFGGAEVSHKPADFAFFIHKVEELEEKQKHIALTGADIKLLNPNTRTCPIFRTRRDAEITKAIYRRVPVLIDSSRKGPTKNPWGVSFRRMFDQTNDAELFREAETLKAEGCKHKGNRWVKGKQVYLPLYEAKMVQMYDHRAADVVTDTANWVRQGQTETTSLVQHANPEHLATPRFWIDAEHVELPAWGSLGFKDITSPTNQRTVIAACGPFAGFTNHFVLIQSELLARQQMCLLANVNSFAYDFTTRQKIGGVTLNFFIIEQIPTLPPDTYAKPCPWSKKKTTLEKWISERVLKLTCTAEDMLPLAEACDFTGGSFKEYEGRLNKWDEAERAELMAELDAAYFHLYGLGRDDTEYILGTFKGIHVRSPLLKGVGSPAELVLAKYDEYAS